MIFLSLLSNKKPFFELFSISVVPVLVSAAITVLFKKPASINEIQDLHIMKMIYNIRNYKYN